MYMYFPAEQADKQASKQASNNNNNNNNKKSLLLPGVGYVGGGGGCVTCGGNKNNEISTIYISILYAYRIGMKSMIFGRDHNNLQTPKKSIDINISTWFLFGGAGGGGTGNLWGARAPFPGPQ